MARVAWRQSRRAALQQFACRTRNAFSSALSRSRLNWWLLRLRRKRSTRSSGAALLSPAQSPAKSSWSNCARASERASLSANRSAGSCPVWSRAQQDTKVSARSPLRHSLVGESRRVTVGLVSAGARRKRAAGRYPSVRPNDTSRPIQF